MKVRINKYPYFLWITEIREDFKVSKEVENTLISDEGTSTYKKVPLYVIILLKYLPILFGFSLFYLPIHTGDSLPFVGALIVSIFMFLIYIKTTPMLLKISIISIVIANLFLIFLIKDYAVYLDTALTFFVELLFILAVFFDVYLYRGYEGWFYLEDFKNEINVKFAQKKERRFLFFIKKSTGFNVAKTVYFKGYFVRQVLDGVNK